MSNQQNLSSFGINTEEDLHYFETDHLALRGNKDYSDVLKNFFILCAQRKQAIKDYGTAVKLKKEALDDPAKVLEKIIKGESLGMPDLHVLPELPSIDWSKYKVKIPETTLQSIFSSEGSNVTEKSETRRKESKMSAKISHGRWTAEEQKKLEELLQIYPPEAVEMRRFQKIANALGNRTLPQVCSRVQKYFLKLYKAGLPVPGRIPKSAERYNKKGAQHKHQRHNHYLLKPTTFFPELDVPVIMNDLDSAPGPSSQDVPAFSAKEPSTDSNYLTLNHYHKENEVDAPKKTDAQLQLELLKRVKRVKQKEGASTDPPYHHVGFKCDFCSEHPIVGARWHCVTCKTDSIDFCTDCVLSQMYSDNSHPLTHQLIYFYDEESQYYSDSEDSNSGSVQDDKCFDGSSENSGNSDVEREQDGQNDEKFECFGDGTDLNNELDMDLFSENLSDNYLNPDLFFNDN